MTLIDCIILAACLYALHRFWCWVLDNKHEANSGRRRPE